LIESQELEEDIRGRLAAVNVCSDAIDKETVAGALEQYLEILKLSARPITWAKDAQHAHQLVEESDISFVKGELRDRIVAVFRHTEDRGHQLWSDARFRAFEAGHGLQLEMIKGLLRNTSTLLSNSRRASDGTWAGEPGGRDNPRHEPPWGIVADALDYAARAAAECAWARIKWIEPSSYVYNTDKWLPFVTAFEAGLWCFWITSADVIALPRPVLKLNLQEQLHSDHEPAAYWKDSQQEFFFLNGVHVAREIVETPAGELDPRLLLRERNADVRRELVRKIGIERVCETLQAQGLDRQGNYELLLLDLQDGRTRPFLKMKNPSIGIYHIEGVAPECRTVAEALAWRNQSDVPPSVLT
jgi:hypothetical protein